MERKYARIFVLGHYLFREANSFPRAKLEENCELWGTDNVQGQISKHVFPQMEAIVFIVLQIFFATRTIFNIGEYSRIFPSFTWGIFGHVTRLDQSRMSEKIWWIIRRTTNFTLSYIWKNTCTTCVPENIHTPPTEGIGISWGMGVFGR